MMNKQLGYAHFWLTIASGYGVFLPMHFFGLSGAPRRYYEFTQFPIFDTFINLNHIMTMFAIIGGLAQVIFLFNFFYSIYRGRVSSKNPWQANTLEWTTPLNPPHGNWPGELPTVHRWAYDYSKPGFEEDYIPQTVPILPNELKTSH